MHGLDNQDYFHISKVVQKLFTKNIISGSCHMASKNNIELIKKIYEVIVKSNGYDAVMKNVRQSNNDLIDSIEALRTFSLRYK